MVGVNYNSKIITNGLVLCVDAGNRRSYPGTGTVWTDLSGGGINGELMNGPTYSSANGGSIVFDGANDYVQCTGSIVTSTATFLVWIYRNGSQGQFDGILYSRGTTATGLSFSNVTNQLSYTWNNASNTWSWQTGLIVPNLEWSLCAISVTSTFATAYLCQKSGITSAVNNVSHTSTTLDDIKIGQDDFGNRFFTGNIAVAQIYNRALSRNEIIQNFKALRGRFGV